MKLVNLPASQHLVVGLAQFLFQMLRLLGHFLNADAERGNLLFLRTNLNFDLTRLLARALKLMQTAA